VNQDVNDDDAWDRLAIRRGPADLTVDVRVVRDPPLDPSMMDKGAASTLGWRVI